MSTAAERARARWQATGATGAADKARAGALRLLAAITARPADPPALMGLNDVDDDVVVELAHRTGRTGAS